MNFMFPYSLVKKGSRIILYGDGNVGKEFYMQLHQNEYCFVEAWVDKAFDYYETAEPFDKVENIKKHQFDYVVVALADLALADRVREDLISLGVDNDKIIWSRFYQVNAGMFPEDRVSYLKNWDFYIKLIDTYMGAESVFGLSGWYQGSPQLGIIGGRNNGERIARYRVWDYLTKDSVCLDIGCNCGFFDLELSRLVKQVVGIDVEKTYIDIANEVRDFKNITNVSFITGNFMELEENNYDAVFSLGVHLYILESGITKEDYVAKLVALLKNGGFLFFESHGMETYGDQFVELSSMLAAHGMEIVHQGHSMRDSNRNVTVFRK